MRANADDQARLEEDLTWVAGRLLRNAYKQAGDQDEQDHSTLARVVKAIVGPERWRSRPTLSLIEAVGDAIDDLPETMSGRSHGRATGTNSWADSPERQLAKLLYGYLDDEVEPRYLDGGLAPKTYGKDYVPAAMKLVGRTQRDSTAGRAFRVVREDLAEALLRMEREALERQASPARESAAEASQSQPALIDRPTYIDAIRSHVDAGKLLVCLWGEPGTGKSVLAGQAAKVLVPRGPVLNLRAGDPDVLRDDIVDALITAGLQPTDWSDSYCRAMLRRALADQPLGGVVVVDNIDEEALIWQLVSTQPQVPILITMRTKPQSPDLAAVELDDFSEEQACSFIRSHLTNAEDTEVLALAQVLGCRPLALDHAVRFLQQTSTVTPRDLVSTLTTSVTDGLNLVANPADKARNLVRLYKIILASVIEDDPVRHLLDSFLAVAGKSGMEDRDLLSAFMQSDAGGSADPVRFGSGFRALELHGLLREAPHPGNRHSTLLIMHPLTYEILRDLRTPVPFQIEYAYLEFLASDEVGQLRDETFTSGTANAWLRKQILAIASRLNLPYGWKTLQVIDALTWVAVRGELEGMDADSQEIITAEYIVRYELHPHGMYKLDYRTGIREALEGEEGQQLRQIATAYRDKVVPFLQEMQERYSAPDDPPEAE